jgi:hypothetical protein
MTSKKSVVYPFPPLLLPSLQSSQTLWRERNKTILESLALMNMEFPDASNLNDIGGFQTGKF